MAEKSGAQSITITIRLPTGVCDRLESLAEATKRSRSFLAAEAIEKYVNIEQWQVAGIEQSLDDERRGLADEEMAPWMESLGTGEQLPMPKPDSSRKARRRG